MANVHREALIAQRMTDKPPFLRSAANRPAILAKDEMGVAIFVCAALLSVFVGPAVAQETRAENIRQQQIEKGQAVAPEGPNVAVRVIDRLEDWGLFAGAPRGPYPWFGSVYPGGGFAAGAGFRKPFADDGAFNVFGGYSINMFARAQADLQLPTFARNHARITLSGRYIDAPDVRYYGVGNSSDQEDMTRFGYRPTTASARLEIGGKYASIGGGVNLHTVDTAGGRTAPFIDQEFSPADTPGLGVSKFTYINSTAHAAIDWRRSPGYTGQGGLYRVQFDDYREQNDDVYSFKSAEAEVLQLIPILRANWVVALRGLATVTDLGSEESVVPYFLLPALGGGSTLRGYPDFRFRDRNRLLMTAELRWTPARFLDMAIFYDTGKVAADRRDLDFNDLKNSYGIGMRLVGVDGYAFRVEVARSEEHKARLIFSAGGSF
jgi:hypothetical protein